ncbi:hypothetical protein SKAU_G00395530 [Synaphobranchus kaupii]|uniref:Uncharacterized protein n=1 Tax=Synaphobranchus kaupii TaxID=118154 RepID=A0A9Q1ID70_SYNKA|nr:hypothetical protein SKAU_G00395530 [Synaphobranchus kaupii]
MVRAPPGQLDQRPDYPEYQRGSSATVVGEKGARSGMRWLSPRVSLSHSRRDGPKPSPNARPLLSYDPGRSGLVLNAQ